ncbi:acetyltransferase [Pseudoalteromonas xiamenensis]|uniref:acetyltransferase n=1 Tax=Pseudoalteromonas xiamenensis TaxID=882626 RepID=UPI0027E53186|nr:acetyltransferase [Pseudoalteromonas xiamenensis]WMN58970.1 acetyltransferase [Pseudoalteromonas xiamenensis]
MLKRVLPNWFVGLIATTFLLGNTLLWGLLILCLGVIKLIFPMQLITLLLNWSYRNWCRGNAISLQIGCEHVQLHVSGEISDKGWYLLVSNHLSWLDIVVLSALDRLPAPKFFLKDELKYVPIIGSGAWALGMPFMKRATKAQIAKNPKLKGMDVARTKASCRAFRDYPTTIINFVEGTRFTKQKQAKQLSPFRHLLKPKAGGTAFALEVLSEQLDAILNTTLVYDTPDIHICRSFMQGRLKGVYVDIEVNAMSSVPLGNYQDDKAYRVEFQQYVNRLWQGKDDRIGSYEPTLQFKSITLHEEINSL